MKYLVVETDEHFYDISDVLDYCIDEYYHRDDYESFIEWVNEHDDYEISGYTFSAYDIVDALDSNCMQDLKEEYCEIQNDSDRENAEYELRHADVDDIVECQAYQIKVCDDLEDENDEDYEETSAESEDSIEKVRRYYDEQLALTKIKQQEADKNEDELMSVFQVIE